MIRYVVTVLLFGMLATVAAAEDDWKKEFETVCCQTDNAMSMSTEQLREYVARCDKIKPAIEALESSPRKVYLKRWKLCRELFKYVLDTRDVKPDAK